MKIQKPRDPLVNSNAYHNHDKKEMQIIVSLCVMLMHSGSGLGDPKGKCIPLQFPNPRVERGKNEFVVLFTRGATSLGSSSRVLGSGHFPELFRGSKLELLDRA